MKRFFLFTYKTFLYVFAGIGLVTTGVFFAMRFNLLDVRGDIDDRNQYFYEAYRSQQAELTTTHENRTQGRPVRLLVSTDATSDSTEVSSLLDYSCVDSSQENCTWNQTTEWAVIKAALVKDAPILQRVETETGVPARVIASVVFPEQARFFSSNREVFKRWFEPMKLLGSLSQFSLGVSGIKQETAEQIEIFAHDSSSIYYPGDGFSALITYPEGGDKGTLLYNRLTDEHDHYYSYLYTALFVKEITAQWERAGFGEEVRPEIIVTLFNLGFAKSKPNANPTAGGATLEIGGIDYTYGTLGGLFYYSEELQNEFPTKL